jgi:hypothetical protein
MNQSTKKQAQLEKSTGGQVQVLKETIEQLQAQIISVRESYEAKIRDIAGAEREAAKLHWAEELNRLRKVNEQMSKDMVALSDESEMATTKLREKNMEMLRELALVHKSQLEEVSANNQIKVTSLLNSHKEEITKLNGLVEQKEDELDNTKKRLIKENRLIREELEQKVKTIAQLQSQLENKGKEVLSVSQAAGGELGKLREQLDQREAYYLKMIQDVRNSHAERLIRDDEKVNIMKQQFNQKLKIEVEKKVIEKIQLEKAKNEIIKGKSIEIERLNTVILHQSQDFELKIKKLTAEYEKQIETERANSKGQFSQTIQNLQNALEALKISSLKDKEETMTEIHRRYHADMHESELAYNKKIQNLMEEFRVNRTILVKEHEDFVSELRLDYEQKFDSYKITATCRIEELEMIVSTTLESTKKFRLESKSMKDAIVELENKVKDLQKEIFDKESIIRMLEANIKQMQIDVAIEAEKVKREFKLREDTMLSELDKVTQERSEFMNKKMKEFDAQVLLLKAEYERIIELYETQYQSVLRDYERRLSKKEDIDRIRYLEDRVKRAEKQLEQKTDDSYFLKTELVNREESYNKVFRPRKSQDEGTRTSTPVESAPRPQMTTSNFAVRTKRTVEKDLQSLSRELGSTGFGWVLNKVDQRKSNEVSPQEAKEVAQARFFMKKAASKAINSNFIVKRHGSPSQLNQTK